jgi:stringent starvation protein B
MHDTGREGDAQVGGGSGDNVSTTASTKPYLIRAIYEWCVDHGYTPYINVRVDAQARVPVEYIKDGSIVLNVSQAATRNLKIDNERVHFSARFNGVSREISVPIGSVAAIFARENGQGMVFEVQTDAQSAEPQPPAPPSSPPAAPAATGGKSHLKIVK